jgi:hypothetical protein
MPVDYLITYAPSCEREPEILTADSCAEEGRHLVLKRVVPVGPFLRECTVLRIERDRVIAVEATLTRQSAPA